MLIQHKKNKRSIRRIIPEIIESVGSRKTEHNRG